jgi:glycosyltransferase involved in cell wall biosynthesis
VYKVSVIIATLNCDDVISNCLDAIFKHCNDSVQVIVQDGISCDDTLNIIKLHPVELDSTYDSGVYDAFNKALKKVKGEWVLFIGADDILLSDPCDIVKDFLSIENVIIYGNVINSNDCNIYDGKFSKLKLARHNICHQAIFYPAHVFEKNKFNLKYKLLADYDLNLRLSGLGYNFTYVNKCWMVYGNSGLSKAGDAVFERDKLEIVYRELGFHIAITYCVGRYVKLMINRFHLFLKGS